MAGYDFFVGALKCLSCGRATREDDSTDMQTKVRPKPAFAFLGIGSSIDITPANMERADYLTIQPPRPGMNVRVIQSWDCPACGSANWAEITMQEGVILKMASVKISRDIFLRANYIGRDDCEALAARNTSRPADELADAELVKLVGEKL